MTTSVLYRTTPFVMSWTSLGRVLRKLSAIQPRAVSFISPVQPSPLLSDPQLAVECCLMIVRIFHSAEGYAGELDCDSQGCIKANKRNESILKISILDAISMNDCKKARKRMKSPKLIALTAP